MVRREAVYGEREESMGMTTPPPTFPARTPLPTEQERYLDMLLMVREAMFEVIREYRFRNYETPYLDAGRAHLLLTVRLRCADDDIAFDNTETADLASAVWIRYIEDREAQSAVSETAAAIFGN